MAPVFKVLKLGKALTTLALVMLTTNLALGETGMNEANLTRFGPQVFEHTQEAHPTFTATFRAVQDEGTLALSGGGITASRISVNGENIAIPSNQDGVNEVVIPLVLARENQITIDTAGPLTVRVRQVTKANLGLIRQGYFGINTTDIERQRKLYELLGFIGEIYPAGPETSTTFARSLGFEDNYLIHVSLHSLENPPMPPFVDTVQFRGESYREEPPYANLNHLGMAYATYSTTDLDGDFEYLKSQGVEFLSAPATSPNGERFVFMKDQDGAFLKFTQAASGDSKSPGPNLVRLANTNMNVSDLERSREFYRLLGFNESVPTSQAGSGEFATAHGFDGAIEFEGEDIIFGAGENQATLQLRQWITPYDNSPPYPPPVNHLGIDRINFYVEDLTATIKTMNELGFEQLAPPGGSKEVSIVFFFDPDGIKVQFAGPLTD